jgi:hypothetical protein
LSLAGGVAELGDLPAHGDGSFVEVEFGPAQSDGFAARLDPPEPMSDTLMQINQPSCPTLDIDAHKHQSLTAPTRSDRHNP